MIVIVSNHMNGEQVLQNKNHYIRLCFWSTTGVMQLVETKFKCLGQPHVHSFNHGSIISTSMYVCIYVYLNKMYYIYIHTCTCKYN